MVNKLDSPIFTSVPHSYDLVPHLTKKLSKLQLNIILAVLKLAKVGENA